MSTFTIKAEVRKHRKDFWRQDYYVVTVPDTETTVMQRGRAAHIAMQAWVKRDLDVRYTQITEDQPMRAVKDGDPVPCTDHWYGSENGTRVCSHCGTLKDRILTHA